MSGIKQRIKSSSNSQTIDANEEYYGYGNVSPLQGSNDKDYRNRSLEIGDKVSFGKHYQIDNNNDFFWAFIFPHKNSLIEGLSF